MQPELAAQLLADLGALGFVLWLAHRLTTHTIPQLTNRFDDLNQAQREDFRAMLERQLADFAALHERDHAVHEDRMSSIVDAVRTMGNHGGKRGHG